MTPANKPALAQDPDAKTNPFMFRLDLLQNDRVRYANQPIAVVIARNARGGDGRSRAAGAALRGRSGAGWARCDRELRATGRRPRISVGSASGRCRGRSRRSLEANRGDLRDRAAISQPDGAACDRGRMGRRYALNRYAEPRSCYGAGPPRGTFRNLSRAIFTSAVRSSAAASAAKD